MASVVANSGTGSAVIDSLMTSARWADGSITFGFTTSASQYGASYGSGETTKGFQALSASQMAGARDALSSWAELINLKITETSGSAADIRIAASSLPATAWAYTPGSFAEAGDVWMGTSRGYYTNPVDGNYAKVTFLHEIGHALGLNHPHQPVIGSGGSGYVADDGTGSAVCPCCGGMIHGDGAGFSASAAVTPEAANGNPLDFGTTGPYNAIDAMAYTVMSYSSYAGDGRGGYTNGTWDYAQSPMVRDIAAIQHLYGANFQTRGDNTVYSWSAATGEQFVNGQGQGAPGGNKVFETIWDGGGRDTIDLSNYASKLAIDLSPGGWINFGTSQLANLGNGQTAPGNVAMSLLFEGDQRSLIENAIGGAGNDVIKGNASNNVLIGGAGDDRIEGLDGHNILAGGTIGNELSYLGLDRGAYISVVPSINGHDGTDVLIGGNGNDIFVVQTGNDTVQGSGGINTLVLDTTLATLKFTGSAASFVIAYGDAKITASDVDFLATSDGIFAIAGSDAGVDAAKAAGFRQDIALVYNAGLDRSIDTSGLAYWSGGRGNGGSLRDLASGIINADEFAKLFGNPNGMNDTAFVQVLYKNVLDRNGESAGIDYWTGTLASGSQSRADVLVGFSLSAENRTAVESYSKGQAEVSTSSVDLVAVTQTQWHDMWA